ncbi:hypothetical protein BU15DRAFT_85554 [Melanogaster broomeanus]|nr:hypothetical protein BU15DRAFT_85554 [Melanogaster broomeanus]
MSETILLCPRPLARYAGRFLLLPLLPHQPSLKPLPVEIWSKIFSIALSARQQIALPLLYSSVKIRTVSCLDKFTSRLYTADQKWDSIPRIPYSTPGRWVQKLDMSAMAATLDSKQAFVVDSLLTRLFPLIPFLVRLSLPSTLPLSRRALAALGGICYDISFSSTASTGEDPIVQLLQTCHNLERLEVIGCAIYPVDFDSLPGGLEAVPVPASTVELNLPYLHSITLLYMPSSSLMYALLNTSLPRLRALSVTPYDDIPYPGAFASRLLDIHGQSLSSLSFFRAQNLAYAPSSPLHALYCALLPYATDSTQMELPLQVLSIPRPNHEFWRVLMTWLPYLPSLKVVRIRDIQWLRRGMNNHAQEAGVQGEMRDWRRRLERKGIRLLDGNWKETA